MGSCTSSITQTAASTVKISHQQQSLCLTAMRAHQIYDIKPASNTEAETYSLKQKRSLLPDETNQSTATAKVEFQQEVMNFVLLPTVRQSQKSELEESMTDSSPMYTPKDFELHSNGLLVKVPVLQDIENSTLNLRRRQHAIIAPGESRLNNSQY